MNIDELDRAHVPDTPRFQADLDRYLRNATRPRASRVRALVLATGLAVVVAAAVIVWPVSGDRPTAVAAARVFLLPDGETISIEEFFDADNFERLGEQFTQARAQLVIHERPVAEGAVGRVFEVMHSPVHQRETAEDPGIVHVQPGDRVEVTVGRAARPYEQASTQGLTLYEVFPDLGAVVTDADRSDPAGTGAALEQLGFKPRWVLVEWTDHPDIGPTPTGRDIDAPPEGTVIVSVLGPNGEWTDVDPDTDILMVEIATPETAQRLGHGS